MSSLCLLRANYYFAIYNDVLGKVYIDISPLSWLSASVYGLFTWNHTDVVSKCVKITEISHLSINKEIFWKSFVICWNYDDSYGFRWICIGYEFISRDSEGEKIVARSTFQ